MNTDTALRDQGTRRLISRRGLPKLINEQLQVFESIPFIPIGQWNYPWAIRKNLTDFVKCAQVLFWGVRRA